MQLLSQLRKALRKINPQTDAQTPWLAKHRPSVAFMLCICSGPWKIGRRRKVQENMLRVMGSQDIMEMSAQQFQRLPLAWQKQAFARVRKWMRKHRTGELFDDVFVRSARERKRLGIGVDSLVEIMQCKMTKTVWMFVRDYWCADCFPVDRHVRKWCVTAGLPARSEAIVELFEKIKHAFNQPLRAYARAVFGEHSSNPIHPPQ